MYRVPHDLDLSKIVGESATQIGVGQFDLSLAFGPVIFSIQSPVSLIKDDQLIGSWEAGKWPDTAFFDVMNASVSRWEAPDDRTIVIHLENGVQIQLVDDSDQYECIQISVQGSPGQVII